MKEQLSSIYGEFGPGDLPEKDFSLQDSIITDLKKVQREIDLLISIPKTDLEIKLKNGVTLAVSYTAISCNISNRVSDLQRRKDGLCKRLGEIE